MLNDPVVFKAVWKLIDLNSINLLHSSEKSLTSNQSTLDKDGSNQKTKANNKVSNMINAFSDSLNVQQETNRTFKELIQVAKGSNKEKYYECKMQKQQLSLDLARLKIPIEICLWEEEAMVELNRELYIQKFKIDYMENKIKILQLKEKCLEMGLSDQWVDEF